jgi:hypothetical protein
MEITFDGGKVVTAHTRSHAIRTDQPLDNGGDNTAPTPYDLFMVSRSFRPLYLTKNLGYLRLLNWIFRYLPIFPKSIKPLLLTLQNYARLRKPCLNLRNLKSQPQQFNKASK